MSHTSQTQMLNKKYFILNYPLANSLMILAILFHIWSGGSEFLGIQGYMRDFIAGKFPGNVWAGYAAVFIPLLLAVTIEFSFVALLRYLLNSLLYKTLWRQNITNSIDATHALAQERYETEKRQYEASPESYGLHRPEPPERPDVGVIRAANIAMYAMAAMAFTVVFVVSMTVSKKSIEYDTLVNGPVAKTYSIDSLNQVATKEKDQVYNRMATELKAAQVAFQRDSLAIDSEYSGKIAAKTEKLNEYAIRERQSDQRFTRSRSIRKQQIRELEAARAAALLERSALLQQATSEIRSRYGPQLESITKDFADRRSRLKAENEQKKAINAERNAWFSGFLRRYAQLATVGQFMCWVYVILAFYVMGIQQRPRVRPESLESGLLADLGLLVYTAPTRFVHNRIRGLLSKVPPLYQMPGVGAVYDIDTLNEIAPLLEQLDKTKSWEEKQKLQRTIQRKIAGYQHRLPEDVDELKQNKPVNPRRHGLPGRRMDGVDGTFSTRRNDPFSTPEIDVEKRRTSVEKSGVDDPVAGVATRSTLKNGGVEMGVENAPATRRTNGVENVESTRRHSVAIPADLAVATTGDGSVENVRSRPVIETIQASIFEVDIREQILLKAQYNGETKEESTEIRVVIDGIIVKGYYNEDYHPHAFFKKMKQNYEGYYRRGQRNMLTNLLRIELAEKYMELIERVGAKYNLITKDGGG